MTGRTMLGALLGGLALMGGSAGAQDAPRFSDIDCARSRIAAAAGLTCQVTQNMSGGADDAEGTSRTWVAYGNRNGAQTFYVINESTSPGQGWQENFSLHKDMRLYMQSSGAPRDFSPLGNRDGADYITFASPAGNACVGVRRYGPSTSGGYRWILHGFRCEPSGKALTESEIDGFIAGSTYRRS